MQYYNWQTHGTPGTYDKTKPYQHASPNLTALKEHCIPTFGGTNLGTYNRRLQSNGGTKWSTHAYGAAWDYGYTTDPMRLQIIDFLIDNHEALGVQMIVDEGHDRTWKCDRTDVNGGWKTGSGVHGSWLHIETTLDMWDDASPIPGRLVAVEPPTPNPTPTKDIDMLLYEWRKGTPDFTVVTFSGTHIAHCFDGDAAALLMAAKVPVAPVNDTQLLALIKSAKSTTAVPPRLTVAMKAAWV